MSIPLKYEIAIASLSSDVRRRIAISEVARCVRATSRAVDDAIDAGGDLPPPDAVNKIFQSLRVLERRIEELFGQPLRTAN